MNEPVYSCKPASEAELARIWQKSIDAHPGDARWPSWAAQYIEDNRRGLCQTFAVLADGEPIGEGTLLFSPKCGAVGGRLELADGKTIANVNALRIEKAHEGKGQISKMMRLMEKSAKEAGFQALSIGVEAAEARNLAIYLHWGYARFVCSEFDGGALVLYYSKTL
ncbi:MAG: GNAT family N-acetyltransferase [Christensenellaceae bacterium]|jgi:GNAT superfamily N-acetyltransferase|nr:GNAT family N-acetyltransferase [Christensenellaceae bacterium]